MRLTLAALAVALALLVGCASATIKTDNTSEQPASARVASSQDATWAWNLHASTYDFASFPVLSGTTFGQMYGGANFYVDFYRLWGAVEAELEDPNEPPDGPMNVEAAPEITNWGG